MRMISIFALLGLVLLGACQKRVEEPAARGQTIVVDNRQMSDLDSIDRCVDTVELIRLESHPQGLIPNFVSGLLTGIDRVFAIDYSNHIITIFNFTTGKFIQRLQPTGEGPGEFYSFSSVNYNRFAEELEIRADFQRKVLIYNKNGVFLREEQAQELFAHRTYLNPDWCAYYFTQANADYFGKDQSYKIVVHNQKTNERKFLLPQSTREAKQIYLTSFYQLFNVKDSHTSLLEPGHSYRILQISEDAVKTRYHIKFKHNPMPENYWEQNPNAIDETDVADKKGFPYLSNYFFENPRFVVFSYTQSRNTFLFGYDKWAKMPIFNTYYIGLFKLRLTLGSPFHIYDDGLLGLWSAKDFLQLLQYYPEGKYLPPAFFSIAKALKPDDNPIIMKVVFKNK